MSSLPRAAAAVLLTLGSLGALVACGGSDEPTESAIEKAIEDNAGEDVDVDVDDGEVKVETDEGTVTSGQGLPDGFPEDEVPIVDGDVMNGTETPQGYYVTVDYDGAKSEAEEAADKKLTGAGFEVDADMPFGKMYLNDKWQVLVLVQEAGGKTFVAYTVGPQQ